MKNLRLKNVLGLLAMICSIFLATHTNGASLMAGGAFARMEEASFDSFDPEIMNFDPETVMGYDDEDGYDVDEDGYDLADSYKGKRQMKKRSLSALSQIDIVIDNSAISAVTTVELFNYLRSNTMIRNTTYNATTFEPTTFDKSINRAAANSSVLSDAQMIYWRSDGSLVYNTTTGVGTAMGTAACIISCTQVPYRVIHEATRNNLLYIEKFRLSVKTSAQIDQSFTYFKNTFLGGVTSNNIAPRSEFKPNQFQTLIVDVPMKIGIDAERGLSYSLVSQEKVTITMFFRFERGNAY